MPRKFLTNPGLRSIAQMSGENPDDPATAEKYASLGMDIGDQPSTGPLGMAEAFGSGAARGVVNTIRGITDIPFMAGRALGMTDMRVDPIGPNDVEQANPVSSALGNVASFLIPAGFVGKAVGKIPWMVTLAERAAGAEEALGAASGLAKAFTGESIAYRAAHGALTMGITNALQPGDPEQRMAAAAEGLLYGSLQSGIGASEGIPLAQRVLLGSLGGAVAPFPGPEQIDPHIAGAVFGGLMGGVFGSGPRLPKEPPPPTAPGARQPIPGVSATPVQASDARRAAQLVTLQYKGHAATQSDLVDSSAQTAVSNAVHAMEGLPPDARAQVTSTVAGQPPVAPELARARASAAALEGTRMASTAEAAHLASLELNGISPAEMEAGHPEGPHPQPTPESMGVVDLTQLPPPPPSSISDYGTKRDVSTANALISAISRLRSAGGDPSALEAQLSSLTAEIGRRTGQVATSTREAETPGQLAGAIEAVIEQQATRTPKPPTEPIVTPAEGAEIAGVVPTRPGGTRTGISGDRLRDFHETLLSTRSYAKVPMDMVYDAFGATTPTARNNVRKIIRDATGKRTLQRYPAYELLRIFYGEEHPGGVERQVAKIAQRDRVVEVPPESTTSPDPEIKLIPRSSDSPLPTTTTDASASNLASVRIWIRNHLMRFNQGAWSAEDDALTSHLTDAFLAHASATQPGFTDWLNRNAADPNSKIPITQEALVSAFHDWATNVAGLSTHPEDAPAASPQSGTAATKALLETRPPIQPTADILPKDIPWDKLSLQSGLPQSTRESIAWLRSFGTDPLTLLRIAQFRDEGNSRLLSRAYALREGLDPTAVDAAVKIAFARSHLNVTKRGASLTDIPQTVWPVLHPTLRSLLEQATAARAARDANPKLPAREARPTDAAAIRARELAKLNDRLARITTEDASRIHSHAQRALAEMNRAKEADNLSAARDINTKLRVLLPKLNRALSTIDKLRSELADVQILHTTTDPTSSEFRSLDKRLNELQAKLAKHEEDVAPLRSELEGHQAAIAALDANTKLGQANNLQAVLDLIDSTRPSTPRAPSEAITTRLSLLRSANAHIGTADMTAAEQALLTTSQLEDHVVGLTHAETHVGPEGVRTPIGQRNIKARYRDLFERLKDSKLDSNYPILRDVLSYADNRHADSAFQSGTEVMNSFGGRIKIDHIPVSNTEHLWRVSLDGQHYYFTHAESGAHFLDLYNQHASSSPSLSSELLDSGTNVRPPNGPASPPADRPPLNDGEASNHDIPHTDSHEKALLGYMDRYWKPAAYIVSKLSKDMPGLQTLFNTLSDRRAQFDSANSRAKNELLTAVRQYRISTRRSALSNLERAATYVSTEMQKIQSEHGRPAAEAAVAEVRARAAESFSLTPNQLTFLSEFMPRYWASRAAEFNIPAEDLWVGYHPRSADHAVTDAAGNPIDPMAMNFLDFWAQHDRQRETPAGSERTPAESERRREFLTSIGLAADSGNFLHKVESYTRHGNRAKYLGDPLTDLQRFIETSFTGKESQPWRTGTASIDARDFLSTELRRFASLPSESDLRQADSRTTRTVNLAKRLYNLTESTKSYVPPTITKALTSLYQSLGIQATEGQLKGSLDWYTSLHRSSIFGFHIARAVRHMATTDLLMVMPRFHFSDYQRAFRETTLSGREAFNSLRDDYISRGFLTPEQAFPYNGESTYASRGQSFLNWTSRIYSTLDLRARVLTLRTFELSLDPAIKAYRSSGNLTDFLERTGLDTHAHVMDPSTLLELRATLDRGNISQLMSMGASIHNQGVNFSYIRPHAPLYADTQFGRFLGQYGAWPSNMVNSLYWLMDGPRRLQSVLPEGDRQAARSSRRQLNIGAKYALATTGVYSLAAAIGIDVEKWIPFIHSFTYSGGPGFSLTEKYRDILNGDPQLSRRFEKAPGETLVGIFRNTVPLPGVDMARRLAAVGLGDTGLTLSKWLGIAQNFSDSRDLLKIGLGFKPFTEGYNKYQEGPVARALSYPLRRAFDFQNYVTGGLLPPGSEDLRREWKNEY